MKLDTETEISKTELKTFKRQVKGYIKWVSKSDEEHVDITPDLQEIKEAKTFEEVQEVLKCWDDGTFMVAVLEGYF